MFVKKISKQLLTTGNVRVPVDESSSLISLPRNVYKLVSSEGKLIKKVFPNMIDHHKNHKWLIERAILTALNEDVDDSNKVNQEQIVGTLH